MEQRRTTVRALACWLGATVIVYLSIAIALVAGINPLPIYASLPHVLGSLLSGTGIVVGALVWGRSDGALPARPRGAVAGTLLGYAGYALVGLMARWMLWLMLLGGLIATIPLLAFLSTLLLAPTITEKPDEEPPPKRRVVRGGRG
ncbi:MAG: hypothetical protein GX596_07240 [Propionibacterium sp.]|nr:hypothetical protein [Propionibacterium sp.]